MGLGGRGTALTAPFDGHPDHVAVVMLFHAQTCKVMNRFRWYTYLHSDDVALDAADKIECGTRSVLVPFEVYDYGRDRNGHGLDSGFRKAVAGQSVRDLYPKPHRHNIRQGYRPVFWSNYIIMTAIDI